jgi:prophage tail gpP-like protein
MGLSFVYSVVDVGVVYSSEMRCMSASDISHAICAPFRVYVAMSVIES